MGPVGDWCWNSVVTVEELGRIGVGFVWVLCGTYMGLMWDWWWNSVVTVGPVLAWFGPYEGRLHTMCAIANTELQKMPKIY